MSTSPVTARSSGSLARSGLGAMVVCAAYVTTGLLGLEHATVGAHITLVWAPAGIAAAATVLLGAAVLPGVFVGAFVVNLVTGGEVPTALGIAIGNTAEPALAALLLRRSGFSPTLRTRADLVRWIALAAGVAPLASAVPGVAVLAATGALEGSAVRAVQTWWLSDATGILLLGPLLLSWATDRSAPRTQAEWVEAGLLALGTTAGSTAALFVPVPNQTLTLLPLLLPLPFLVWAGLRFGLRGAMTVTGMFATAAIAGVSLGLGPLGGGLPEHVFAMWFFVTAYAVTGLLLGALHHHWQAAMTAAAAAEERLALAAEGALAGAWDWDLLQQHVVRTDQWGSILGYGADEIAPTPDAWNALTHPLDRRRATAAWHAHVTGEAPRYEVELRMRHADGRWRWMLDQGVIVARTPGGRPARAAGTQMDITARKLAEVEEFRLRRLVRVLSEARSAAAVGDAVVRHVKGLLEAESIVLLHASGDDGMLAVAGAEGPTRIPVARVVADLDGARGPQLRLRSADSPAAVDVPVTLDDDLVGLVAIRGVDPADVDAPVLERLGAVADHCAGTLRRLRSDARREALEATMLHAQKLESLGVLAGGIAHDFNNMLATISGNTSLALLDLPPDDPVREPLEDVELAASRAAELCRQLLAYAGRGRFVTEVLDPRALVREMATLLDLGRRKNAQLVFELDPDTAAVSVDAGQIRQVLLNLITNASDALPEAGGTIVVRSATRRMDRAALRRMWVDDDLPEGDYVELQVKDDGSGMPPDVLSRIFDPFFTTKFSGRGLGLAAVLGILRSHGGAIRIETQEGVGTTFFVYLPAERAPLAAAAGESEPIPVAGPGVALVVDDEPELRRLVARALERAGWEVDTATDGADGVEVFEKAPDRYDVVVLDMTMPRMGGAEALARMRAVRSTVRVVLTSGFVEHADAVRLEDASTITFLPKPWTPPQLLAAIAGLRGE